MNYVVTLAVAGLMAAATMGCCCPKSKSSCSAKSCCSAEQSCCCKEATKGMNLSAEQQARVDEILSACSKEDCSPEACEETSGQISRVLNDEQKAAYAAAMEKMADKNACTRSTKACN